MRATPSRLSLAACFGLFLAAGAPDAAAQQHTPGSAGAALPSAEQVLADYHRAAGGVERLAGIRDVTVEWRTEAGGRQGTAVSRRMAPGFLREELGNGAANVSTPALVWRRRPDGSVSVDSSTRVVQSRLQASLEASHLVGLAEQGIAARVVGADSVDGEPAYRVEFSRDGAQRVWLFGARSHLPLRVLVPESRAFVRYSDYRPVDGVLEAHRVEITNGQPGNGILFLLQSIRHNTGLTEADFLPARPTTPEAP